MVVKNPIGLGQAKIALAEPEKTETSAIGEANIATNINNIYVTNRALTAEEEANKKLAEYRNLLAKNAPKQIVKPTVKHVASKRGGFDAIYAAAEKRFGVSRYLLAAVHYVETGQRGDTTVASYAGAQGPMQFMPSTFRAYAVDGDGDGVARINDVDDAIHTAAKYLAANGAASGNVRAALYRYNHSNSYINHVLSVARSFGYTA
jgi:membrane-bound lytic murein transglycosylase B